MPSQTKKKTKRVLIVNGPSKIDLMLTLFDSAHRGISVTFIIDQQHTGELSGVRRFSLNSVGFIDQSKSPYGYGGADAFALSGDITFLDRCEQVCRFQARGEYDTRTRKGFLDLVSSYQDEQGQTATTKEKS